MYLRPKVLCLNLVLPLNYNLFRCKLFNITVFAELVIPPEILLSFCNKLFNSRLVYPVKASFLSFLLLSWNPILRIGVNSSSVLMHDFSLTGSHFLRRQEPGGLLQFSHTLRQHKFETKIERKKRDPGI